MNALTAGALGLRVVTGATDVLLILISPLLLLSLPLSLAARFDFVLLDASWSNVPVPRSNFSEVPSRPRAGVFGWLISCTVSNVELAPLAPLAGVLMPVTDNDSSASVSSVPCLPSDFSVVGSDR